MLLFHSYPARVLCLMASQQKQICRQLIYCYVFYRYLPRLRYTIGLYHLSTRGSWIMGKNEQTFSNIQWKIT